LIFLIFHHKNIKYQELNNRFLQLSEVRKLFLKTYNFELIGFLSDKNSIAVQKMVAMVFYG
jgi:hypothetical protein